MTYVDTLVLIDNHAVYI